MNKNNYKNYKKIINIVVKLIIHILLKYLKVFNIRKKDIFLKIIQISKF